MNAPSGTASRNGTLQAQSSIGSGSRTREANRDVTATAPPSIVMPAFESTSSSEENNPCLLSGASTDQRGVQSRHRPQDGVAVPPGDLRI